MNLYFRFLFQIIRTFFAKKITVNDIDRVNMRVWPIDLDANFHMNNGVFLSLMDLGRTRFSIRSGLFSESRKRGWGLGVVGGVNITYLKSLMPFQKFKLVTKLAGHYDGWVYIEQRFETKGKLVACALIKVIFLKQGKKIDPKEIITAMNATNVKENNSYLEQLYNSEKEFLSHVKQDY